MSASAPAISAEFPADISQTRLNRFARRLWHSRGGAAAAAVLVLVMLVAVFRAQIATHDPLATDPVAKLQSPSSRHFFGTDELGRDVFSRLVYGTRVTAVIGIGAALLGVVAGSIIGLTAGYLRGPVDGILHSVIDACLALPPIVILLALGSVVRLTVLILVVALAALVVSPAARVVRAATLAASANPYIEAAQVLGAGTPRILLLHLLPNAAGPIIAMAVIMVGNVIVLEAS